MGWIFTKPWVVKDKCPVSHEWGIYQSLFLHGEGLTFRYWMWNINSQQVGNWYSLILFPSYLRQFQFTKHGKLIEHNFNSLIVENHTALGNWISCLFQKMFEIFHQVVVYKKILALIWECYTSRERLLCDWWKMLW